MKQGDFTQLAQNYINRPSYSEEIIQLLIHHICAEHSKETLQVADIGAGTGKLTEILIKKNISGWAVEPNDAMRAEGIRLHQQHSSFQWVSGSAEHTTLETASVDWVTMASAFHWTNPEVALQEFARILKPRGFFTALWNPRDLQRSVLEQTIDQKIREIVPELKRVSSGASEFTKNLPTILTSTNDFEKVIFIEAEHEVIMSKERYLGVWRSVNDIQAQAGPERFQLILDFIAEAIQSQEQVTVPYKTRAWTVQKKPN